MAVVEKQRKDHIAYYVVTFFQGRQQKSERAGNGRNKEEAKRLDARRKREVKDGTYVPPDQRAPLKPPTTVRVFAERWKADRTNVSAKDDVRNIDRFLALSWLAEMLFEDVRPKHVIEALKQLRRTVASEKTLKNGYGSFRTMCRDAVIDDVTKANPCVLPRSFFDGSQAKEREIYTKPEAVALMRDERIPSPVRMLNALCLLGGLREGEACGRRWRDLDPEAKPLWGMTVASQYLDKQLKTKKTRQVPVHPELAALLQDWAEGDFVALMGRKPHPDDFIVPLVSNRSGGGYYTRSIYYKAFIRGCKAAKVRARSLHSTRHTMITMARRGGADRQVLSKVTHNAQGEIIDRYTHHEWEPLCAAVLAIGSLFGARPTLGPRGNTPLLNTPESEGENDHMAAESHGSRETALSSIPGASTQKSLQKPHVRQSIRQRTPRHSGSEFEPELAARERPLLALDAVGDGAAAPGLAMCRGYAAALAGDEAATLAALTEAFDALQPGRRAARGDR